MNAANDVRDWAMIGPRQTMQSNISVVIIVKDFEPATQCGPGRNRRRGNSRVANLASERSKPPAFSKATDAQGWDFLVAFANAPRTQAVKGDYAAILLVPGQLLVLTPRQSGQLASGKQPHNESIHSLTHSLTPLTQAIPTSCTHTSLHSLVLSLPLTVSGQTCSPGAMKHFRSIT